MFCQVSSGVTGGANGYIMVLLMTESKQPYQEVNIPESDQISGAELVVKGLAGALAGTAKVTVTETDGNFELAITDDIRPDAA